MRTNEVILGTNKQNAKGIEGQLPDCYYVCTSFKGTIQRAFYSNKKIILSFVKVCKTTDDTE